MKLTGYYTTAGEKIAAGLLAGATLSVTRITAGSGSTALSAAALDQEQQNLGPCEPEVSGTTAVMRCTLSSDQAKAPYFLRELGVYAMDDTQKEVLYLIFRLDEEVSINPAFRLVLRFNLEQTLSDGAGIQVTAPLTGLATQEDLKTKADLAGGQVPYAQTPHLTSSKTIYVDPTLGDDANTGTQSAPFRTIQAALDAAPKDLGGKGLTVLLAPGVYDEDVSVKGFFHRSEYGYLEIRGAANPGSGYPEATHRVKSISVGQNACHVSLTGLWVYGANASGRAVALSTPGVSMDYCTVKNEGDAVQGVIVGYYGHALATLKNIAVDGYPQQGIAVDGASVVALHGANVTNNGVGISAAFSTGGGILMLHSVTYSGNTIDTKKTYGGQIFGGE